MTGAAGQAVRRGWNGTDRLGLIVLLCLWSALLAFRGWRRPAGLATALAPGRSWADDVRERIDPNTASAASLRRLPMIGPARAGAIVNHRRAVLAGRPGRRAFLRVEDLRDVHGIGPGTIRRIRQHLSLPAPAAATRPR